MAIREQYRPGDQIVVIGLYENASTLNFYTGIPLHSLRTPGGNMWYGTQFPGAPRVFETQASFVEMWKGPQRVFLWAEEDDPPALRGLTQLCGRAARRQDYFCQSADAFAVIGGSTAIDQGCSRNALGIAQRCQSSRSCLWESAQATVFQIEHIASPVDAIAHKTCGPDERRDQVSQRQQDNIAEQSAGRGARPPPRRCRQPAARRTSARIVPTPTPPLGQPPASPMPRAGRR